MADIKPGFGQLRQRFAVDIIFGYDAVKADKVKALIGNIGMGYVEIAKNAKKASEETEKHGKQSLFWGLTNFNIAKGFLGVIEKQYETLTRIYYLNRQFNQSNIGAGGLLSFGFAGQQIGLSANDMLNVVQSYTTAMRMNPGLTGLLRNIAPKAFGGAAAPEQDILALVNALKNKEGQKGYFVAARLAENFGINEDKFAQMWFNIDELNAEYKAHQERLKSFGLDTDKATENFAKFNRAINTVIDILEIQATRVGAWLAEKFGIVGANNAIAKLTSDEPQFMTQPWVKKQWDWLTKAPTEGEYKKIIAGKRAAGIEISDEEAARVYSNITGKSLAVPETPESVMNYNLSPKEAAIANFMSMGLSRNAAIGAATGLQGESGQNINYQSLNKSSGAYGIANWLGARKKNFEKIFGHPIEQSTHAEQWSFLYSELQGTGGDPQTAKAYQLLRNPDITALQATNVWENMVERHGDAAYTAKLASQAQNYAAQNPSPSKGTTQNFDIDHAGVTVNVHGNMDYGTLNSMNSILNNDFQKLEMSMRQSVRAANFR